jgi:PHD/YefM family antitoxin component YafN of YafNO toxin-antitoxin module
MIDLSKDIRSLSDFKRKTAELVERMEESGNAMVLTVNGKARLVVQDATAYQKLLDGLDEAEAVAGIRRGLEDVRRGRKQSARRALADIRKKHGIRTRDAS